MVRSQFAALTVAFRNDKGVTAAEYAILATGIIIAIGTALAVLTPGLAAIFGTLITKLPS